MSRREVRRRRHRTNPTPGRTPADSAARSAATAVAATSAAAAAGLVDLGGGIPQRGTDLLDFDLDHRALLPFTGFERALLEPSGHDHPGTAGKAFGHVLGGFAPDVASQKQRLAVLPLPALAVVDPRRGRHGEVRDGSPGRGEPQFRVCGQISDDGDGGVTSHGVLLGSADARDVLDAALRRAYATGLTRGDGSSTCLCGGRWIAQG